jgi:hypothetical protein
MPDIVLPEVSHPPDVTTRVVTRGGRLSTGSQEIGEVVHLEADASFAVDEEYPDPAGDVVDVEVSDEVLAELDGTD